MALTSTFSADKQFRRNDNTPANLWVCVSCFAAVMVGDRTAHKGVCPVLHPIGGFGA